MHNRKIIGLDFETFSDVDLKKHGVHNYMRSPYFKVLLAAVAIETPDSYESIVLDFVAEKEKSLQALAHLLTEDTYIVAHNAIFEYGCLVELGIPVQPFQFIDSAVCARATGFGGSLEAAAPQVLGIDKMESGRDGILTFCVPGTYQMDNDHPGFDPKVVEDNPEKWLVFAEYCALDAMLSLRLAHELVPGLNEAELLYAGLTLDMNLQGWKVDVPLVEEMQDRYRKNTDELVAEFRLACDAPDLNLNSSIQMAVWCHERGVRASSFDEQHVAKMKTKLLRKLEGMETADPKVPGYSQVLHLLETKQALGGSSLKKLQTILDTASHNGRLYDQYLHAGAATTLRTTGRSVQMQNLKRLGAEPDDVEELLGTDAHWSNEKMAHNLRQVFTATDPEGFLIVGDFKAVESRGLAWFAGEDWKLDTYRQGLGVYEMQASRFFGTPYEDVTKDQRMFGKVGELSCGYQAGADAVKDFAEKMNVTLSHGEAAKLVSDFRTTNPRTVQFWADLQSAMEEAMETGMGHIRIPHGTIDFVTSKAVESLEEQTGRTDLRTLIVKVDVPGEDEVFRMHRVFHGVHMDRGSLNYWRSSERKTGDLWVPDYTDPKTGKKKKYSLYGGKMAGILTQSLCRQLFMGSLSAMYLWSHSVSNVRTVGQFHDEIVVDWKPEVSVIDPDLETTAGMLKKVMSTTDLTGFPLEADVKHAYRYIK